MKTIVIVAHPNLDASTVNKKWVERLREEGITVHELYKEYPDFRINIEREQMLLEQYDRIIFQFPWYWFSSPALLKEWVDVVFTYGWAFGTEDTKLQGKDFLVAISTGGPAENYQPEGFNRFRMEELITPFHALAVRTGMLWQEPFLAQGVSKMTLEQKHETAERLVQYLKG